MTDIIMQHGQCTYWGCENFTKGLYCREHKPTVCRVCGCKPYGSRGLTLGLCNKHYKQWQRHSPQRARILAEDRARAARTAERKREARRKAREKAREAAQLRQIATECWENPWKPANEAERLEAGGWSSGSCLSGPQRLILVQS